MCNRTEEDLVLGITDLLLAGGSILLAAQSGHSAATALYAWEDESKPVCPTLAVPDPVGDQLPVSHPGGLAHGDLHRVAHAHGHRDRLPGSTGAKARQVAPANPEQARR